MLMRSLEPIPLAAIEAARDAIRDLVVRTPLVRLNVDDAPTEIYLKLENLQPIGSFKLRGAGSAFASIDASALQDGVFTASAGNMAQGVAWVARERARRNWLRTEGTASSACVIGFAPAASSRSSHTRATNGRTTTVGSDSTGSSIGNAQSSNNASDG